MNFLKPDTFPKSLAALGILGLVLVGYFHPITSLTQDLGRHLFTGNLILQTGTIPSTNLYSFTNPLFPFQNHHWLSEVIFALIQNATGFVGLFILMLALLVGAVLLQVRFVFQKVTALALGVTGILYMGILFERQDLRPELFSFFFLSLFITLLYRNREHMTRWIYVIIPLQLLWVNMHIYFAIGIGVVFLFLVDAVITQRKNLHSSYVISLGSLFLCMLGISLVNPHGVTGLLYPLRVFENYGYTIEENQTMFFLQSLGFQKPSFPYFITAVVLLWTCLSLSYKKTRPIDWLLAAAFSFIAYMAVRNFPLFVFATFIPFSLFLSAVLTRLTKALPPLPWQRHHAYGMLLGSLSLLFIWQLVPLVQQKQLGYAVAPGAKNAVDFMVKEQIHGPFFNNFDIGSYLIYRLYPTERVFVDGRPEAYPESFFSTIYKPMQENPALFSRITEKYGITTIFFSHTDQTPWGNTFLKHIVTDPEWSIVYLDDYAIILVKKIPANTLLIKRFGMDKKSLTIAKAEDTFEADLRLTSFFTKIGWVEEGLPVYLDMLQKRPDFCPGIELVSQIYQYQQNPTAFIYSQQYTTHCL